MEPNAAAQIGHLPFFITGPGETDVLLAGMIIFTIVIVLLIGVFYLYLHALPERMAHSSNSTQLQLVGILTLLALFTHNNLFWVIALLIVAIRLPDFVTPINSIAQSLLRMADGAAPSAADASRPGDPPQREDDSAAKETKPIDAPRRDDPPTAEDAKAAGAPQQGDDHA